MVLRDDPAEKDGCLRFFYRGWRPTLLENSDPHRRLNVRLFVGAGNCEVERSLCC
jgi:hypothetical protein